MFAVINIVQHEIVMNVLNIGFAKRNSLDKKMHDDNLANVSCIIIFPMVKKS